MGYGSEIRENRKKLGLTQTELAVKAGVSRAAIWLWESETAKPTNSRKLAALENALKMNPGSLYLMIYPEAVI